MELPAGPPPYPAGLTLAYDPQGANTGENRTKLS